MAREHSKRWTWIAFDAVGTLIFPDPPVAAAYWHAGREHGSQLSQAEIGERFRTAFQQRDSGETKDLRDWQRPDRLRTNEDFERERWQRIVAAVLDDVRDPDACFRDLYRHFAQPQSWRCFPEVPDALLKLRSAGFRLALASNFDHRLDGISRSLPGLAPIERCVISTDVGYRKPSLHFFRGLCGLLACIADDVLLVGDDETSDVRGGREAGLEVWPLRRGGLECGSNEFATLTELAKVLC